MHPTPAERLLAMLDTDDSVESMPKRQVRKDLEALGIDPARSVAFAKALARSPGAPAERLMGALLAAEDEEEEIARIETTDIEEVRARVDRGTAAAVTASARRRAGGNDNVVGLKGSRRRRLVVWGGPLAGIAASLLVAVFFLGNSYLQSPQQDFKANISAERSAAPAPEAPVAAKEGYTKPGPDKSPTDELQAMNLPRKPESAASAKEEDAAHSPEAPSDGAIALSEAQPSAPEMKNLAPEAETRLQKREEFAAPLPPVPPEGVSPEQEPMAQANADAVTQDDAASSVEAAPAAQPPLIVGRRSEEGPEGTAGAGSVAGAASPAPAAGVLRDVEISEIAAALVVDPSQAPLQIQSPGFPTGGLEERLAEARRLAGDRPVIALYSIARAGNRRDYAQIPLGGATQQFIAPPPLIGLLGVDAGSYDFIPLPPQ